MKKTRKAFSLVEAMVGIIIISIISAASWVSLGTLVKIDQTIRKNNKANYLVQKSQEELRKVAQAMYDVLEQCDYSVDNPCGFDSDISEYFEGFERTIEVKKYKGSTELKVAHMRINWEDMGEEQETHAVMFLARPPSPMPGTIAGEVYETGEPGTLIGGVEVTATRLEGAGVLSITSSDGYQRGTEINYDFTDYEMDPGGRNMLNVGLWEISGKKDGYGKYYSNAIIVKPNKETRHDFEMPPEPEPGYITGYFMDVDVEPNESITFSRYDETVYLCKEEEGGGRDCSENRITRNSFSFEIPFESSGEIKCFTIATDDQWPTYRNEGRTIRYPSGEFFAGNFSCVDGPNLSPYGWSSSIVRQSGEVHCNNPWYGGPGDDGDGKPVDRVCLMAEETVTLDIPLVPVPKATVSGTITDDQGVPLVDADMYVYYHYESPGIVYAYLYGITDADGNYSVSFPAEQELFPDEEEYYPDGRIFGQILWPSCCGEESYDVYPNLYIDRGLWAGDNITEDVIISSKPKPSSCGSIRGNVTDSTTGRPIMWAKVTADSYQCGYFSSNSGEAYTDENGDYEIHCDPNYALNAGCDHDWYISAEREPNNYVTEHTWEKIEPNSFITVNFSLIREGDPTPTPTPTATPTPTTPIEPTPTETGGL